MHHSLSIAPPRVGVRVGERFQSAMPVVLGGQRASLMMDSAHRADDPARLRLDWDDGRVTELDVRVRGFDAPSCVTHVDICRVDGDWRPFLEYLALTAC